MSRLFFSLILGGSCVLGGGAGWAEKASADKERQVLLARADRALERGFPHAVLESLRETWAAVREREEESSRLVLERLLAAEVMAGETEVALERLEVLSDFWRTPEVLWWRAQAFLERGAWREAAEAYAAAEKAWPGERGDEAGERRAGALIGEARAWAALGESERGLEVLGRVPEDSRLHGTAVLEASGLLLRLGRAQEAETLLGELEEVPPEGQRRHSLLLARARQAQGNHDGALLALGTSSEGSLGSDGTKMTQEAALLQAQCLLALENPGAAVRVLENYLRQATGVAPREEAFLFYDDLLSRQSAPSLAVLRMLAQDAVEPTRAAEAARYLALAEARAGRWPAAREILRNMPGGQESGREDLGVALALAEIELQAGQAEAVLSILAAWPEERRADFLRGRAYLQMGEASAAAEAFARAAEEPGLALEGWFNASVAWMVAGVPTAENTALWKLEEIDESGMWRDEFRLAAALEMARNGAAATPGALRDLLPAMGGRAAVPLAEWMLVSNDAEGAREILQAFPDGGDEESRAFLEIFLAGEGNEEQRQETERRARRFLREFAASQRAGSVRLKLAELRLLRGDFVGANEEFSLLAQEETQPEVVQQAWFLAGQAAARIMTEESLAQAMLAYEEAAASGGELGQRARFEQGLLAAAQGEFPDALVLLDRVATEATDPELRAAAGVEKGDVYFAMGAEDRAQYRQAVAAWRALAADDRMADHWRRQALTKAGLAHEQMGEIGPALEAFYEVLLEKPVGNASDLWLERSGFEAGRLLERRQSWREAIRVYEKVAGWEGARAEEAATRANRLRLENFLWED
jgi:hypothetical protein